MSLEEYKLAVNEIANRVWEKFGPQEWRSANAYETIKQEVRFSSWIVSISHAAKIRNYFGAELASTKMMEDVEKSLEQIVINNAAFHYKVRFVSNNRFLTVGEMGIEHQQKGWGSQCVFHGTEFETPAEFCLEIEAEEAADEFCAGYLAAGVTPPRIQIVGFNSANKEIPRGRMYVGPRRGLDQSREYTEQQ